VEEEVEGVEGIVAGPGRVVGVDLDLANLFQAAAREIRKAAVLRYHPAFGGGAPQKGQDQVRLRVDSGGHEKALLVHPDEDRPGLGAGLGVEHLRSWSEDLERPGGEFPQPDVSLDRGSLEGDFQADELIGQEGQDQEGRNHQDHQGFPGVPLKNVPLVR